MSMPRPSPSEARPRLRRQITVVLGLKLIALGLLWAAFFRPDQRPLVTPAAVAQQRFDGRAPSPNGE